MQNSKGITLISHNFEEGGGPPRICEKFGDWPRKRGKLPANKIILHGFEERGGSRGAITRTEPSLVSNIGLVA